MALAGHNVIVEVSEDDSSWAACDGANSFDLQFLREVLETTEFEDDERTRILGLKDFPISISGDYSPSDTGQGYLETAADDGDTIYIRVKWDGTNGHKVPVKIENFSISATVDGKVEFSCSAVSTGDFSTV